MKPAIPHRKAATLPSEFKFMYSRLMVNLTHNLMVSGRLALKRFVVVRVVEKPQCATLILDGKTLVTRGYHRR